MCFYIVVLNIYGEMFIKAIELLLYIVRKDMDVNEHDTLYNISVGMIKLFYDS